MVLKNSFCSSEDPAGCIAKLGVVCGDRLFLVSREWKIPERQVGTGDQDLREREPASTQDLKHVWY